MPPKPTPRYCVPLLVLPLLVLYLFWIQHISSTDKNQAKQEQALSFHGHSESDLLEDDDNITMKRPRFILHIGPHKTATTTLECALLHRTGLLHKASFAYVGKRLRPHECGNRKMIARFDERPFPCFRDYEKCWPRFQRMLREAHQRGENLILSDELLAFKTSFFTSRFADSRYEFWETLLDDLRDWDVTVVFTYRRWYEWLPSVKQQFEISSPTRCYRDWPSSPQCVVAPIYTGIQQYMTNHSTLPYPYVDELLDSLQLLDRPELRVKLLNMHESRDLLASFACDVLELPELCHADWHEDNRHASLSLFYDMLSVEAWQRGWISSSRNNTRKNVKKRAQKRHEVDLHKSPHDFPLVCPTQEELLPLLYQSHHLEEMLVPDFYRSTLGKESLTANFLQAVENEKYCSIDTEAVLKDPEWKAFFQSL